MGVNMDKYDEAIKFLQKQGGYHEECAELIQELLHRVFELEQKPISKKKQQEIDDMYRNVERGARSWYFRNYSFSPAKELSE